MARTSIPLSASDRSTPVHSLSPTPPAMSSSRRIRNLLATVAAASLAPALGAQVDISGTLSVGGGGTLLDGNRAAYQSWSQHQKDGFGGIEDLTLVREGDNSTLKVKGQLLLGDEQYGVHFDYENYSGFTIDAGYSQFRTYYDADGGYIPTDQLWLPMIPDVAATDRSKLWFELGFTPEDLPAWKLRYQRDMRDGTKGSTHWGDSSLSTAGSRYIVPSFYQLDETRDTFTADISNASVNGSWNAGVRYQETEMENLKNTRRRPFESADRYLTTRDQTSSDLFAIHGYVSRNLSERWRMSVGAIHTKLDTQLDGTRIFGSSGYDPVYDVTYPTRQQRDEGYYDLTGDNQLKQTVANLNFVYTPNKNWSIRPTVRFEDLRVDNASEFIETQVGRVPPGTVAEEEFMGESSKDWQEVSGRLEVRYTGAPQWTHSLRGEWLSGNGTLMEELIDVHTNAVDIDRDTDLDRTTQKYTYSANWYAQPGLSFAAQAYYRLRVNDFTNVRDSTPSVTSGDRYPAYIIGQDFETTDFNIRMTWRPASNLTWVTRYDIQDNSVVTTEAGYLKAESSTTESRIFSQSITWLPTTRWYLVGTFNAVDDDLVTPATARVGEGNNDYISGTITSGYAVSEASDLLLDFAYTKADNYVDSSDLSVPYLSGFRNTYVAATWVYRASENLVYHFRYSYSENRDDLVGTFNDYEAHTFYAKVQYKF